MRNALILIVLVIIGTYLAWTKAIPFKSRLRAPRGLQERGQHPQGLAGPDRRRQRRQGRERQERLRDGQTGNCASNYSEVTFTVDDERPAVHEDAQVEIRPRIFLEGNFFLDVKPGSPSAHELSSGDTIPVTQTSTAVQLDQILTTLQAPDRENLQKLLEGYGTRAQPQADAPPTTRPRTRRSRARPPPRRSTSPSIRRQPARRDSAIVNEALQGTAPHDLSNLIAGQAKSSARCRPRVPAPGPGHQLQHRDRRARRRVRQPRSETIRLLGPTLELAEPSLRHTNATLPLLRAFAPRHRARASAELPATIAASQPWLEPDRRRCSARTSSASSPTSSA